MPTQTKPAAKATGPAHSTIAGALAAFQAEMPVVNKGKSANIPNKSGGPGYRYSYADLADVTKQIAPLLAKHGLAFTAHPRAAENGYELAATLMHDGSDQTIEGALPLFGRTSQEIGSAITYARRYLLGCLTGVVTDDDEDGNIAAQAPQRTRHERPAPAPRAPQAPQKTPDTMLDEVLATTTVDEARRLWDLYNFKNAPEEYRDHANTHIMMLAEQAQTRVQESMKVNDDAPADDDPPEAAADDGPAADRSDG